MPGKHYISAAKFKAECLKIMDEVNHSKETYIITKRRHPVAQITPISLDIPPLFGKMQGTVLIKGDIISPTGEQWDADR